MVVELHRKVSSLIEYLKQKWTYHDQRIVSFKMNAGCYIVLNWDTKASVSYVLNITFQLESLREREALEGRQSGTASPNKSRQEELFLYPAESSTLTTLPGVARVVHSKASCTVHWTEAGKTRPNAKELPAAQILGIQTAQPFKAGAKSGRGSATASGAASTSGTVLGDGRRTEAINNEPLQDGSSKSEDKAPQSVPVQVCSQQAAAQSEEGIETGPCDGGKTCTVVDATVGLAVSKSTEKACGGTEGLSEQCKEEHNTSSSSAEASHTPPGKPAATSTEEGMSQGSVSAARERAVEQIRVDGWSTRDSENVTLAELYLMFGKPGKLQLEYEWQSVPPSSQDNGQGPSQTKQHRTHRVLRCLLRLVATEVNPKPLVWMNSSLPFFVKVTTVLCGNERVEQMGSVIDVFLSGSRAVLHSHVADKEPSGGTNPDSHTSRKRSHCGCSQSKLWSAAGFCARGPFEPIKLRSLWWEE